MKPCRRRQLGFFLRIIYLLANIMINQNIILYENKSSPLYQKIHQVNIVALMIIASCTLCMLYFWIHYYLEIQNKHKILEIFNFTQMNFDQYKLSKLNERRLFRLTWIIQKLFIEQQVKFIGIIVSSVSACGCVMVIYEEIEQDKYPLTIMLTILHATNIMILARLSLIIELSLSTLFILSIIYLTRLGSRLQSTTYRGNKAWFKTIANESKREISIGRSYLG